MKTPKENVRSVLSGATPERTPYRISVGPDIAQRLRETYGEDYHARLLDDDMRHRSFWVRWPLVKYVKHGEVTWIDGVLINEWSDLDSYPFPTGREAEWFVDLDNHIALHGERYGVAVMFPSIFHACMDTFRGSENFLMDVYDEPDRVRRLQESIIGTLENMVDEICRREIDLLIVGDDVSTENALMVSPDFLREHVFKYNRRLVEIAHRRGKKVFFHTDGVLPDALVEMVIDCGFDGMHPLQFSCNDLEVFAAKYRNRLLFYGGLDNTQGIPNNDIPWIENHVRKLHEWFGERIILSSSDFMGGTPDENILALPRIIKEICRFGK